MNLNKELAPHIDALRKWKLSGSIEPKLLDPLKRIYEDFWKVKNNIGPAQVKLSCPGCVSDMLKALLNNFNEMGAPLVDFKGVPDHKPLKPISITMNPDPVQQATEEEEIAFYKTHLNAKGIKYHHKAGIPKLKELYEANR